MRGKLILVCLLAVCGAAAYVLYGAFKSSPDYKNLVTDQMKMEFVNYAKLIEKSDQLKVADAGGVAYSVDVNRTWNFIIHDKTLMIQAPPVIPTPAPEMKSEIELQARKSIEKFTLIWLADKFHTKKDLTVEVRF